MSRLNTATRTEKYREKKSLKKKETNVCTGIAYKTVMLTYTCKEQLARILQSKKWKKDD